MFVDGISSKRSRGIGAARKNVGVLYEGYHVWGVTTSGALDVVGMDCSTFERCRCPFDKARFVQGIAMDLALNIEFVADAASLVLSFLR